MNQPTVSPNPSRSKRLLFAFVLISCSAATFAYYSSAKTVAPSQKIVHQEQHTKAVRIHPTFPSSQKAIVQSQAVALQHDIAFFNGKHTSVPFTNEFRNGSANPGAPQPHLLAFDSGYVISFNDSSFLTTPAVYDHSLYVSGGFNSTAFYAFDAASGALQWSANLSDDGPSSPVVTDSMILFNTESCTIFALQRKTGKQAWAKWLGDPLLSTPATDGKKVYTAYPSMSMNNEPCTSTPYQLLKPSHGFVALDIYTGEVQWQRWLDGDVMTTPVIDGDDIFLTTFAGTLYHLSAADGKILGAAPLQLTSLPVISGDKIYTTQRSAKKSGVFESVVEIDKKTLSVQRTFAQHKAPYLDFAVQQKSRLKATCTVLDATNGFGEVPAVCGWETASRIVGQSNVSSLQNFVGSAVIVDHDCLYNCAGDQLQSISLSNGKTAWTYALSGNLAELGGHLATMPVLCGEELVTVTRNGDVLFLDKTSGRLHRKIKTDAEVCSQPVIAAGRIFIPAAKNSLLNLKVLTAGPIPGRCSCEMQRTSRSRDKKL